MTAFKACGNQLFPNQGQVADVGPKHIYPLAAGDLGIKPILLGYLSNDNQFLRRDFSAGNTGHHRIRAALLNVGEVTVVGILGGVVAFFQDHLIPK